MSETLLDTFDLTLGTFFGLGVRLSPLYLVAFVLIAYLVFRKSKPGQGFWAWLFPAAIYRHASHWMDIKLFVFDRLIALFAGLSALAITTGTASGIVERLAESPFSGSFQAIAFMAFATLIINDFVAYWVHRISHEWQVFWPFHAVHHSAEVMSPITNYRKHPVYVLISVVVRGLVVGVFQALVFALMVGRVDIWMIGSVNAAYFIFHVLGSNLRHSHVWFSYGPVLERILISPAQHQIHHSTNIVHFNKNFGEVLAIWDWMFGTLYIPKAREDLTFGLTAVSGQKVVQPHATFLKALLVPFRDSARAMARKKR